MMPDKKNLVLYAEPDVAADRIDRLKRSLQLEIVSDPHPRTYLLYLTKSRLEIRFKSSENRRTLSFSIDFTKGKQGARNRKPAKELITQAVKINRKLPEKIIDATGGLGRDSFILASAGCMVDVCERNPCIAALLEDGLARAENDRETAAASSRIRLHKTDAVSFLQHMKGEASIIYLDPMFPQRTKSAKVKKETELLQMIVTDQHDAAALFHVAWEKQPAKIVVKRPVKEQPLCRISPTYSLKGRTVRFDIYIPRSFPSNPVSCQPSKQGV